MIKPKYVLIGMLIGVAICLIPKLWNDRKSETVAAVRLVQLIDDQIEKVNDPNFKIADNIIKPAEIKDMSLKEIEIPSLPDPH